MTQLLVAMAVLMSIFAGLPVVAADSIEVILTDVTNSNASTKKGDAKIQVSIKGDVDNVTAMQTVFDVTGDLDYVGVKYLVENDAPEIKKNTLTGKAFYEGIAWDPFPYLAGSLGSYSVLTD